MKVINNGKGLIIEANYDEAASLTEAIRKGAARYEQEDLPEIAEVARGLINQLMNEQIIEKK